MNILTILLLSIGKVIGFNFQFKNEMECLKKILFKPDLIGILMEMNEIHCDSKNIDFKTLFTHIEIQDDENKKTQEVEKILNSLNTEN